MLCNTGCKSYVCRYVEILGLRKLVYFIKKLFPVEIH